MEKGIWLWLFIVMLWALTFFMGKLTTDIDINGYEVDIAIEFCKDKEGVEKIVSDNFHVICNDKSNSKYYYYKQK